MSSTKPTVFLEYGFCEGPRIGWLFLQALRNVGFEPTDNRAQADIFIGHSGGCLLPPGNNKTKLIVFIGFPYWPDESLFIRLYKKNRREHMVSRHDGTYGAWWRKLLYNTVYFWNMPRNFIMLQAMRHEPHTSAIPTLCIRNQDDDCCTPDIWQTPGLKECAFLSVPGVHDHLWMHPDNYAAIIKAYYGASILASAKTE